MRFHTGSGIGELASVYNLTRLFDAHKATFVLKRSMLVTWDEAQLRNLIFIGSRAENPSLRVLPGTTDFTMMAAAHKATFVLKRSMLVTWDEAQLRNLIFIGSRAENQ